MTYDEWYIIGNIKRNKKKIQWKKIDKKYEHNYYINILYCKSTYDQHKIIIKLNLFFWIYFVRNIILSQNKWAKENKVTLNIKLLCNT